MAKKLDGCGILQDCRYLLHDRDTKYTLSFRAIVMSGRVKPLALPPHSPNLNAYAERWVRSVASQFAGNVASSGALRSIRTCKRVAVYASVELYDPQFAQCITML